MELSKKPLMEHGYILYAALAREGYIVGEAVLPKYAQNHSKVDVNTLVNLGSKVIYKVSKSTDSKDRKTYKTENMYDIHYSLSHGVLSICICDATYSQQNAFGFLGVVEELWEETMRTSRGVHRGEKELADEFSSDIMKKMVYWSDPKTEKIKGIMAKTDEIKDIMKENIEGILERGEKLSDLEEKSNAVENIAETFKSKSVIVKRRTWLYSQIAGAVLCCVCVCGIVGLIAFGLVLFVVIVYGLLSAICGFDLNKCF